MRTRLLEIQGNCGMETETLNLRVDGSIPSRLTTLSRFHSENHDFAVSWPRPNKKTPFITKYAAPSLHSSAHGRRRREEDQCVSRSTHSCRTPDMAFVPFVIRLD